MRSFLDRRPATLAASVVLLFAVAGCSSASGADREVETPTTLVVTYGTQPTESAKMVCGTEGQTELGTALSVSTTAVTTPTWVDHLYSCTYQYDSGSVSLSVKELPTIPATIDYYNSLKAKSTVTQEIALGQEGFMTSDDSSVVRKDNKVLVVDVTKLPARFGEPSRNHTDASFTIAVTLLGCWTGE